MKDFFMKKTNLMLSLLLSAPLAQAMNITEASTKASFLAKLGNDVKSGAVKAKDIVSKKGSKILQSAGKKLTEVKSNLVQSRIWNTASNKITSVDQYIHANPYKVAAVSAVVGGTILSYITYKLYKKFTQPQQNQDRK